MSFFKFIFFMLLITHAQAVFSGSYEILRLKGELQILRNGVVVNPPIIDGDTVKVSKGGLLILKGEGVVFKLSGETTVRPFVEKDEGWVDLVKGMIVSQVVKKKFQVKSRGVSFAVRGTKFFVSSDDAGKSWMCVNEGKVMAINPKTEVEVPTGLGVFVDSDHISRPQAFAWTKGINWDFEAEDIADHRIDLNYDILENIYD